MLYLLQQIHVDPNFQQNVVNGLVSKNNYTLCLQAEYT